MSLLPRWFNRVPSFESFFSEAGPTSGLQVSSDEKHVYIEAHLPGLKEADIEVSLADDTLWIKGEKKEETKDKKRKFYRKSMQSFSYCVPLGEEVDLASEPQAKCEDGILTVTFKKKKEIAKDVKKIKIQGKK